MPFRECGDCRLTVYSAAGHSTIDDCPRCGTPLSGAARSLFLGRGLDRVTAARHGLWDPPASANANPPTE